MASPRKAVLSPSQAEPLGEPQTQARSWDYAGWMLKSAPKAADCDKEDTVARRLGKWVRAFLVHSCAIRLKRGAVPRFVHPPRATRCIPHLIWCILLCNQANSIRNHIKKHSDFKRRFFVLDHHDLRYYSDATQTEYRGHIDLGTVSEVHESTVADAPPNAIDLVRHPRSVVRLSRLFPTFTVLLARA